MLVFMFPGQGSQRCGMGDGLFDMVDAFKAIEPQVDELLGFSVRRLCRDNPDNRLNETRYLQPCLYVVNALHHHQALAGGARPEAAVGHSLGEYNALLAAGAFDFFTGLRLVKKQSELMSQAREGTMTAVLGLPPSRIVEVLQAHGLADIDIAAFNAPGQTVIAGPVNQLVQATQPLMAAGAQTVVPLAVSEAFHSRYMIEASKAFDDFLADIDFQPLRLRVVANVTGRPYPTDDPAVLRAYLVKQMVHPILWTRSMRYLLGEGATALREIGPGQVLTRLMHHVPNAQAVLMMKPPSRASRSPSAAC